LIQTLKPLAGKITVISGNFPADIIGQHIYLTKVDYDQKEQSLLIRIPKYLLAQLIISYHLLRVGRKVDIVVFFVGGTRLLLPVLTAKLLRKKTIQVIAGSGSKSARITYAKHFFGVGGFAISHIISALERFILPISDKIIADSPSSALELGLNRYNNKLISVGARFVDTNRLCILKSLNDRKNIVGYLGRLSPEKGIMNLVKAIPLILAQYEDVEFLIGGDGPSLPEIEEELKNDQFRGKVTLAGRIPDEELPQFYNQIKLFVLPSYTEGLPQVILEAMACSTPVLATPVGSIPDVIKDGETGFIMEDNSPESVTRSVIRALKHLHLEDIAKNSRYLMEYDYTFEAAVQRYKTILASMQRR